MRFPAGSLKVTSVSAEATVCGQPGPLLPDVEDTLSDSGIKSAGSEHTGPLVMLAQPHHN